LELESKKGKRDDALQLYVLVPSLIFSSSLIYEEAKYVVTDWRGGLRRTRKCKKFNSIFELKRYMDSYSLVYYWSVAESGGVGVSE